MDSAPNASRTEARADDRPGGMPRMGQAATSTPPSIAPRARRSRWRRHWRRWLLVALAAVVAITWVGARAMVDGWSQPPLELPATAAPPDGPLDGTWQVGSGSAAGFRIEQSILGMHGDIVGRTDRVTGTATVAAGRVTAASFEVDLPSLNSKGRPVPRLQDSLDTTAHPTATFALDGPVDLGADFASGATALLTVNGQLTLRGAAHAVSATVQVRRDGAAVDVSGVIAVDLAAWGVGPFEDAGPLGSIADHGSAEFLLVLTQS